MGESNKAASVNSIFKWSVIGILGVVAIGAVLIGVLAYNFSPLLKVDEENGVVQILGGLIDIKEDGENFSGTYHLSQIEKLNLEFKNGKLELDESPVGEELSWNCLNSDSKENFKVNVAKGLANIDLTALEKLNCNLKIPQAIKTVNIKGSSGKVDISDPNYNLDLSLANGMVELSPKKNKTYSYSNTVTNGVADSFEELKEDAELKIKISLNNGVIKKKKVSN